MGLHRPADRGIAGRVRALGAVLNRRLVRYEPVYIAPWVASRDVETFLLLENNHVVYSRRRRGLAPSVRVDVRRYDSSGRVLMQQQYDVKPGPPEMIRSTSTRAELECGFYQITDGSQYYVQIRGFGACALTHGRSTVVAHWPAGAASLMGAAGRLLRPYRKGLNFIYTPTLYETILLMNLSSSRNVIDIEATYDRGARNSTDVRLPPFGSALLRFNRGALDGTDIRTGFARMRASGPFDFYVLLTRFSNGHEVFSIQHVN